MRNSAVIASAMMAKSMIASLKQPENERRGADVDGQCKDGFKCAVHVVSPFIGLLKAR